MSPVILFCLRMWKRLSHLHIAEKPVEKLAPSLWLASRTWAVSTSVQACLKPSPWFHRWSPFLSQFLGSCCASDYQTVKRILQIFLSCLEAFSSFSKWHLKQCHIIFYKICVTIMQICHKLKIFSPDQIQYSCFITSESSGNQSEIFHTFEQIWLCQASTKPSCNLCNVLLYMPNHLHLFLMFQTIFILRLMYQITKPMMPMWSGVGRGICLQKISSSFLKTGWWFELV